jgi:hypothetical protein
MGTKWCGENSELTGVRYKEEGENYIRASQFELLI